MITVNGEIHGGASLIEGVGGGSTVDLDESGQMPLAGLRVNYLSVSICCRVYRLAACYLLVCFVILA